MADRNEFVFQGKVIEQSENGTNHTLLNQDNVTSGSGIEVTKSGDNVAVALDVGVSVVNGLLCATFQVDEE